MILTHFVNMHQILLAVMMDRITIQIVTTLEILFFQDQDLL